MAFNKRTWKGRQGTGLNKFSINGATPVTVVNQPDSITEVGDALSAGNLNDLENRIADAFDETASQEEVTNLSNALTAVDHRVQNLESAKGDYVAVDSDKGVITTPSGKGKWAVVEKLRGVSRADNQLCYRDLQTLKSINTIGSWSNNVYTHQGISYTVNNDGSITVSGTSTAISLFSTSIDIQGGTSHKYLVCGCPSGGSTSTYMFGSSVMGVYDTNGNGNMFTIGGTTHRMAIRIQSGVTVNGLVFHPTCRDLTLYFGSTVPTLSEIQTYYPWLLEPSDYGTSLVDSVYEGVKSVGVNRWNEEWELGDIASNTGQDAYASTAIRSVGYIKVKPDTSYYFHVGTVNPLKLRFYDINKNYIGYLDKNGNSNAYNNVRVTPSNCFYMRFAINDTTTYNDSITIAEGSTAVTYHAYMESTLSLPSPITLRSAGSVAESFDLESGVKTENIGNKKGTELSWAWYGQANLVYAQIIGAKIGNAKFICNLLYQQVQGGTGMIDKACGFGGNNDFFYIRDTSLSQAQLTAVAQSLDINYELATQTTEQLDPIQNPTILTESGGPISAQTEEPIDGNFSVGFITL